MSLDDAISAARRESQHRAQIRRQEQEQRTQMRLEQQQLLADAVQRLQPYGNERVVRVRSPARWYHLEVYRADDGTRYRVVTRQRCWRLRTLYDGTTAPSRSVLLLEDGTIGSHRPEHLISEVDDGAGRYVATEALGRIEHQDLGPRRSGEAMLDSLTRVLGEAVVSYENGPAHRG